MSTSTKPADSGKDELLHITSPANWVALSGLLALVLAALAWSYFGRLPVEISGRGVLLPRGGLTRAQSPFAGVLSDFDLEEGQRVQRGGKLATLTSAIPHQPDQSYDVTSPTEGVVIQHLVDQGNYIQAGAAIALIADGQSEELEAWVFVPFESAGAIAGGMPVFMTMDTVAPEESGYLEGKVDSVGQFPITEDRLADTFGEDPRWISYLLGTDGPKALVKVLLAADPSDPSGYRWTMGRGPDSRLSNGMVCNASIRVSFARPIDAAVPKRGRKKS
jgi:hypothetical protein